MNQTTARQLYGRFWRSILLDVVQTIALAGCGGKGCMKGNPPRECAKCSTLIIRLLLLRSSPQPPRG